MRPVLPRELRDAESKVIAAAIARAAFGEAKVPEAYLSSHIRVVGLCECGCDSLFFEGIDGAKQQYRVADGLGYTADGEEIGIIVWAANDRLVHLELYNYSERPAQLPLPETVCPFEKARRTRE